MIMENLCPPLIKQNQPCYTIMFLLATFCFCLFPRPRDILDFKMRRGASPSLSPYATWDASKMDGASPPSPRERQERHRQGAKVGVSA